MEMLLTALTLGFLGSLHCVGMCGPIALSLPVVSNNPLSRVMGIVAYNGGRVFTYAILGFAFGLLGKTFIIAGYQQALSIVLGLLILSMIFLPHRYKQKLEFATGLFKPVAKLKTGLSKLFIRKTYSSLFSIGVLNGLLPCGLVYTAVAGAIALADVQKAGLFMALFGLGTVPAMLGLALTGQKISLELRNRFRKVVPVFVGAMAVLLIMRGLNLGIPYVSPELDKSNCTKHHCCAK
ncbi:MAG: hypothetical protein JWO06_4106 [Bacteroidota bacterium]|nr:hypothetical protein [Bacteroidota bacterium]